MRRAFSGCFRIIITLLVMAVVTMSEAADTDIQKIQKDLVGSWIVEVGSEVRTRTLNIRGADRRQDGIWDLDSTYGWTDGEISAVKAELIVKPDGYTIHFTTQSNSLISAEYSITNLFRGTFKLSSGRVSPVRLEKVADEEVAKRVARLVAYRMRSMIKQPSADVPVSCAGFVGVWTGIWPRYPQTWLWVVEVNANCAAKYAHRQFPISPETFGTAEIKGGVLAFPDRQGDIDSFELRNTGEIWARHQAPDGNATTVFRRFQPSLK